MIVSRYVSIFCSNETATPEIYTLPYTTLFRSRGGVRIRAADEQSRLRDALLGRHDVQDALPRIVDAEERDAMRSGVRMKLLHHVADLGNGDALDALLAAGGRHVMIGERENLLRSRDRAALRFERF